ncbi:hypothetical protein OAH00_00770 [bacterium]|nr:hypothetical protein [bacterium]
MRLLLILSACLLVGCGNEYEIKKGTKVNVYTSTQQVAVSGILHKVKSDVVILKKDGKIKSIPKSVIISIQER